MGLMNLVAIFAFKRTQFQPSYRRVLQDRIKRCSPLMHSSLPPYSSPSHLPLEPLHILQNLLYLLLRQTTSLIDD
ncbi:hypothetical protein TSMEX_003440 [Taenia solium]|eukprot:TsM_000366200 transcript=TsM_000366200 gene=TsM_000366200